MKNTLIFSKMSFAVIVILLLIVIFERAYIGSNLWRYTHWLFNYDIEFVKRGLAGQILFLTHYDVGFSELQKVWLSIAILASIAFSLIVARTFFSPKNNVNTLFFLLALISSATVQHFIYDFGRFDSINLILAILSLFLIQKLNNAFLYFLIPILCILMVLFHEAAFFMFIPLIMSYWLYVQPKNFIAKALILVVIIICTYFVSTKGLVENMNLKEHHTYLEIKYGSDISISSLNVLHRNIKENLDFTTGSLDEKRAYDHLAFFITFLPLFFIFFKIISTSTSCHNNKFYYRLLVASCFSPILLYPVGEDHFRWWAIVFTNLFIITSLIAYQSKDARDEIFAITTKYKKLILMIIVFSIILGPLGNPSAYPFTINQYFINAYDL